MTRSSFSKVAPYQIFFPLGVLNALLAVGVWFVQNLGWFDSPALLIHSKLIVGGFLWSFIIGFLMTAVPRMTGTGGANLIEFLAAGLLMLGQTFFSFVIDGRFFYANQAVLILFLLLYAGRRILKMTRPLPVFFSHVGLAMVVALLGSYYYYYGNSFMGIHLYHLGSVLLLVLGIGTRFFAFLSGLPSEFESDESPLMRASFHMAGVMIALFLILAGNGMSFAYLGLAAISLFYLIRIWKVRRSAERPSPLKYGVRIVAASIPVGFVMTWLQPEMYLAWFHLLFIGCFGVITFSVATRVTLAHGSYSTDLEKTSKALWWMIAFLVLGAICRVLYGYSDGLWRVSYLHLAATFWFGAVLSWCFSFFLKIFKPGPQAKPSC